MGRSVGENPPSPDQPQPAVGRAQPVLPLTSAQGTQETFRLNPL